MKWLILLLLIPYVWFLIRQKSRYSELFPSFFGVKLVKKTKIDWIFIGLNIFLIFLILLIIIDPKLPLGELGKGNNVVLVIDTSGSMIANDIKPTRFSAALKYSAWLIKRLKSNDYVGIIGFSDYPYIVSFLTQDKDFAVNRLINAIHKPQGGTNIGDALIMATDLATGIPRRAFIILLSDGQATTGTPIDKAIEYAKKHHVQVFTIAVGSKEKTFVGYDEFGNPQYVGVDVNALRKIAEATHGIFFRAIDNADLDEIYKNLEKQIVKKPQPRSIRKELSILFFITFIIYIILKILLNVPY